jgi:hypothetical protein
MRWVKQRKEIAPDVADRILREAGFLACEETPARALGWRDRRGGLRIEAVYPNGWRASLRVNKAGYADLKTAITFTSKPLQSTTLERCHHG